MSKQNLSNTESDHFMAMLHLKDCSALKAAANVAASIETSWLGATVTGWRRKGEFERELREINVEQERRMQEIRDNHEGWMQELVRLYASRVAKRLFSKQHTGLCESLNQSSANELLPCVDKNCGQVTCYMALNICSFLESKISRKICRLFV